MPDVLKLEMKPPRGVETVETEGGKTEIQAKANYSGTIKIVREDAARKLVSSAPIKIKDECYAPTHMKDASRVLNVPMADLSKYVEAILADSQANVAVLGSEKPETPADEPKTAFRVRGKLQPADEVVTFADIWEALAAPCDADDPVVEWDDTDTYCVLDLDFHKGQVPDEYSIRNAADTLRPVPSAWWVSRNGGLHAMYVRTSRTSAMECAALGGQILLTRFPTATVEYKHRTRQPAGEVVRCQSNSDTCTVGGIRRADAVDYSAWLEEYGLVPGERYSHERCPVNPHPRAEGNSNPVCVYDDHVYCHICNADGVRRGSRTAGYFPLAILAGTPQQSLFDLCVRHMTHWGHAKHVVGLSIQDETTAELVYRAALKQRHGDDPRIEYVFRGPAGGLLRYQGYWSERDGGPIKLDKSSATLGRLPCAMYTDDNGKLKTNAAVVEQLANYENLTAYGYHALKRVWGYHLTQCQEQPADIIPIVTNRFSEPQYIHPDRRVADPWCVLEGLFPGLNRSAVELLIAAKGCSELTSGLPPMLFFYGPTGSGKSQSVYLAAAICGDDATTVEYDRDRNRFFDALRTARDRGSFAFLDEYLKTSHPMRPETAMSVVLSLKEDTTYHMLYRGKIPLGPLPVIVFADTTIPAAVWEHAQVARRVHVVHLLDSKKWSVDAKKLRTCGKKYVDAADTILSEIMERYFSPGPPTNFAAVAASLGFKLLQDSDIVARKRQRIRAFFDTLCKAKDEREGGWKCVDLNADDNALTEAWKGIADKGWIECRLISELDTKETFGLDCHCVLETESKRSKVFIRFKEYGGERVNDELRSDGLGNAERGGPPKGRGDGVPCGPIDTPDVSCLPDW